jgi:hypothetical protein
MFNIHSVNTVFCCCLLQTKLPVMSHIICICHGLNELTCLICYSMCVCLTGVCMRVYCDVCMYVSYWKSQWHSSFESDDDLLLQNNVRSLILILYFHVIKEQSQHCAVLVFGLQYDLATPADKMDDVYIFRCQILAYRIWYSVQKSGIPRGRNTA